MAMKYLGVSGGAFDKLCDFEKNDLGDMVFPRVKKLKVLVRLSHLIGPSLAALTIYCGIMLGINSGQGAPIAACGIVFGALLSVIGSMCIEDSPVLKFLKYRKICFPKESLPAERSEDVEWPLS